MGGGDPVSFYLHVAVHLFQHRSLEGGTFLTELFWCPCWKSVVHNISAYFWCPSTIPLINMPVLMPVPYSLDYCGFVVSFKYITFILLVCAFWVLLNPPPWRHRKSYSFLRKSWKFCFLWKKKKGQVFSVAWIVHLCEVCGVRLRFI